MSCEHCKTFKRELKQCSRCKQVKYCSKKCQENNWKTHKKLCCKNQKSVRPHNAGYDADCRKEESTKSFKEAQAHNNAEGGVNCAVNDEPKQADISQAKCATCEKVGDLKTCVKCKVVKYCSRQCQKTDWSQHKEVCHELSKPKCAVCEKVGDLKTCVQCQVAQYCSKHCQKTDWSKHKEYCHKLSIATKQDKDVSRYVLDEEDKLKRQEKDKSRLLKSRETYGSRVPLQALLRGYDTTIYYEDNDGRFFKKISPEKARVVAVKPPGSLEKAKAAACDMFPGCVITDDFDDIPHEHLKSVLSNRVTNILVAFMFKYHGHVMRHGVYLQDKEAAVTRVEFYLDHVNDDPTPHFRYDDVKPGNYICLENPYIHNFGDGSVGIRMDDPSQVKVINIDKLAV